MRRRDSCEDHEPSLLFESRSRLSLGCESNCAMLRVGASCVERRRLQSLQWSNLSDVCCSPVVLMAFSRRQRLPLETW